MRLRESEATAVVELKALLRRSFQYPLGARPSKMPVCRCFMVWSVWKTHCKLALLVRRDPDGVRSYAHIGTGNYNATTARIYTDLSLFTANPEVTRAVHDVSRFSHRSRGEPDP